MYVSLDNRKAFEWEVEEFAAKEPAILDLYAWRNFLEIYHNNPDPGHFAIELTPLFKATWSVLIQANNRTDK